MPTVDVVVRSPVVPSFRVCQVAGMFGLPLEAETSERFVASLPDADEDWDVGLITGPSGSGKTTIARQAFPEALPLNERWAPDQAVIDQAPTPSTRDAVQLLTAVGFGSPPAWIRPFHTLSGGEQFRCELALALARAGGAAASGDAAARPIVVVDEFTSLLDRRAARACAASVAKAIRRGNLACRLVAVGCHHDVAVWLEADWTLEMPQGRLARGRLRRPPIRLAVRRCDRSVWPAFARHHYLSGSLAPGAECFVALWDGEPAAFAATLPLIARRGRRRFTRIVTLPDYQGLGIGMRLAASVADEHAARGLRTNLTTGHPAVIGHCQRRPEWRLVGVKRFGTQVRRSAFAPHRSSAGRAVVSFEWVGAPPGRSASRPAESLGPSESAYERR